MPNLGNKAKTEHSLSNKTIPDNNSQGNNTFPTLRKVSADEAKSDLDETNIRRFSLLKVDGSQNRSRSFSKPPTKRKE